MGYAKFYNHTEVVEMLSDPYLYRGSTCINPLFEIKRKVTRNATIANRPHHAHHAHHPLIMAPLRFPKFLADTDDSYRMQHRLSS